MEIYHNFHVLNFNIRSLSKNFDNFLTTLRRFDITFDVIILTECWLDNVSVIPQIEGYTAHCTQKVINQNSGVVAYIRNKWNTNISEPDLKDANCLQIQITNSIVIFGIYRPPSFKNINNFLSSLDQILYKFSNNNTTLVLAGDINIDLLSTTSNQDTEYMLLTAEHGLFPAITKPTRAEACLDHVFVNKMEGAMGLVCCSDITDHDMVLLGLQLEGPSARMVGGFKLKHDFEGIKKELSRVDWSETFNSVDLNKTVNAFCFQLQHIINKHTRKVSIKRKEYNIKPWITPGLIRCMRHRDRLHILSRKHPADTLTRIVYTRYRNFCNSLLRKLKTEYYNNTLSANTNNHKKLWKSIKDICHFSVGKQEPQELLKIGGATDAKHSLNICNSYFSTVGQTLANHILGVLQTNEKALASKIYPKHVLLNSFFMHPTDEYELGSLILALHNDKAAGIDDLSNALLKQIKSIIISPLTAILNLSIQTGVFPDKWKMACIKPIYKNGEKDSPQNYRPISLLTAFSKLLEKIVSKRLIKFIEANNLISPRQFGFRAGRSTEDAVNLLTSTVATYLDAGKASIGVFLDLSKAFDTVSIPILLRKLESQFGVRGLALDWFRSYLTGRKQCVRVCGLESNQEQIDFGVPQGSILGPTLFILYINDIHANIKGEIICYADDTVLIFEGSNWPEVFEKAEAGLSCVSKWLRYNLLTLNSSKTNFVCFHKTAMTAPNPNLQLQLHSCKRTLQQCNCEALNKAEVVKYLGILIDQNINFKAHIKSLSGRVRKIVNIMKLLRDSASTETLRAVYLALCQSMITYCLTSWGSASKTHMLQLERAQRSVLKTMLKKPLRYSTTEIYKDSKVLNVRQLFILKLALKVHQSVIASEDYENLLKRRVFKLSFPVVNSCFAKRFSPFIDSLVYNKVNSHCDIKYCSVKEAKIKITSWLATLTYDLSEQLFIQIT